VALPTRIGWGFKSGNFEKLNPELASRCSPRHLFIVAIEPEIQLNWQTLTPLQIDRQLANGMIASIKWLVCWKTEETQLRRLVRTTGN
jgi:hypothetical protein